MACPLSQAMQGGMAVQQRRLGPEYDLLVHDSDHGLGPHQLYPAAVGHACDLLERHRLHESNGQYHVTIGYADQIGFALKNATGGRNAPNTNYGANQYTGGSYGSTHWFDSNQSNLSNKAYSDAPNNCSLSVDTVASGHSSATVSLAGTCGSATPTNASPSCAAPGTTWVGRMTTTTITTPSTR
jgi:hypothetical protein